MADYRCPFTTALRRAVSWVPCGEENDTDVNRAIERWHVDAGVPCPPDDQFAAAVVEMPARTSLHGADDWHGIGWCEVLRVTMPSGARYWLSVDHEGGGGDDGQSACTYYNVRHARMPEPRRSRGEKVATCVVLVLIALGALVL